MTTLTLNSNPTRSASSGKAQRLAEISLALIVIFGLGDLGLTLHALSTTGMYEDNPLVVALIRSSGSPLALVGFKLVTMLGGVALLYRLRRFTSARVGAAIGAAAMAGVLVMWVLYNHSIVGLDLTAAEMARDPRWVRL